MVFYTLKYINAHQAITMINETSKSVIVSHLEKINHLSRRAVLVLQAVSTTGPVVASVLSPEEIWDFCCYIFQLTVVKTSTFHDCEC